MLCFAFKDYLFVRISTRIINDMDSFLLIVYLLPIVFIFHDFEEIIFIKPWINRNRVWLQDKYPVIAKRMLTYTDKLSTSAFAMAVFEEFIVLCIVTFTAIYFNFYVLWLAVFMAFSLHLIGHIIQWFFVRRYTPAIVTTIIVLPYSVYGFKTILNMNIFTNSEIIIWTIVGIIIMILNLLLAHKIGRIFENQYQ